MTLQNSCIATTIFFLMSIGQAQAKKSAEEECAKYKPDRTVSSEASSDASASASAKGTIFGGSAAASTASAEKTEKQALSQSELEKQEKIYKACLFYKDGDMTQEQWDIAIAEYMGHAPPPPEQKEPSMKDKLAGAMATQMLAQQNKGKGKSKKKAAANLKAAPKPCGRFAHMQLHVPSRYAFNSCKDDGNKAGRYLFHAKEAKGATCEHIRNWAGVNGFNQVSSDMTRAKDTLVFSKGGFPNMTVKCVNTPRESGKPTRLVFILSK